MGRHAPSAFLTKDEETELLKRIAETGDQKAKDRFIMAYMPLVHKIVSHNRQRFGITAETYDDYVQEGVFGLLDALRKYDASIAHFSTYSQLWILQHLRMKRMKDQELTGQRPNRTLQRYHIIRAQRLLCTQLLREATSTEIAVHTGFPERIVDQELAYLRTHFTSVNAPLPEGDTFSLIIEDKAVLSPESYLVAQEEWQDGHAYIEALLSRVGSKFSPRNTDIFLRRYGFPPYTKAEKLHEIHAAHRISRERVRQVIVKMWKVLAKGNSRFTYENLKHIRYKVVLLSELLTE
jgi:RNA polymerase sigma factor (sigma-70 family)